MKLASSGDERIDFVRSDVARDSFQAAFHAGSSISGLHTRRMLSWFRAITRVTANKASDWQRGQRIAESPIASQSLQR
jgi:hypothetical protein